MDTQDSLSSVADKVYEFKGRVVDGVRVAMQGFERLRTDLNTLATLVGVRNLQESENELAPNHGMTPAINGLNSNARELSTDRPTSTMVPMPTNSGHQDTCLVGVAVTDLVNAGDTSLRQMNSGSTMDESVEEMKCEPYPTRGVKRLRTSWFVDEESFFRAAKKRRIEAV